MNKEDYYLNIKGLLLLIGLSSLCIILFSSKAQSTTYTRLLEEDSDLLSKDGLYYRISTTPINHLNIGDILAAPYQPTSTIISAEIIDGELPAGLSLIPNGLIIVNQTDVVKVGTYPLAIKIINEQNEEATSAFSLQITEAAQPDADAFYEMGSSTRLELLVEGEVLAQPFDKDGSIQAAKCVMGNLPPGTKLTSEGKILVVDRKLLVPNTYNAAIVTIDKLGGATFFMITVPIESTGDIRY